MNLSKLKNLIWTIVNDANSLMEEYVWDVDSSVNYVCIFCQDDNEFEKLSLLAKKLGTVVNETKTGPLFQITPLETTKWTVKLLKVRSPDKTRPERGDADFTIKNYAVFKDKYINQPWFRLIVRKNFEMIEIYDHNHDVRVYFSNPTLEKLLGIK